MQKIVNFNHYFFVHSVISSVTYFTFLTLLTKSQVYPGFRTAVCYWQADGADLLPRYVVVMHDSHMHRLYLSVCSTSTAPSLDILLFAINLIDQVTACTSIVKSYTYPFPCILSVCPHVQFCEFSSPVSVIKSLFLNILFLSRSLALFNFPVLFLPFIFSFPLLSSWIVTRMPAHIPSIHHVSMFSRDTL